MSASDELLRARSKAQNISVLLVLCIILVMLSFALGVTVGQKCVYESFVDARDANLRAA